MREAEKLKTHAPTTTEFTYSILPLPGDPAQWSWAYSHHPNAVASHACAQCRLPAFNFSSWECKLIQSLSSRILKLSEAQRQAQETRRFKATDILLDTSTNDGLNLIPFNFYAAHSQEGVLPLHRVAATQTDGRTDRQASRQTDEQRHTQDRRRRS